MPGMATDAVDFRSLVRRGDLVVWGQAGAEPVPLVEGLMAARADIGGFRAFIGISLSDAVALDCADHVQFQSYVAAGAGRALARAGQLEILPVHYSQLAAAIGPVDVLMLQLAQHPETGRLQLAIAHEYLLPLLAQAQLVIAEINDQAPFVEGGRDIDPSRLTHVVRTSRPPLELPPTHSGAVERRIGENVAGLIEDGSTLQIGIGSVPEAVLANLAQHRDLGVHSGAIGDAIADLTESGVITNACKAVDRGTTIAGMLLGSRRIYQFAHANPAIQLRGTQYTHALDVIRQIDRFVAINSAVEVDLTGQVNAEMAGGHYVGGVGGAVDFARGAAASHGGLPIIALPSTGGRCAASRIVSQLNGPVSTSRADAGIVVTEYGVADLRGRTLRQRQQLMIDIAHPSHRAQLEQAVEHG